MRVQLLIGAVLAGLSTPAASQAQLTATLTQSGQCTKLVHAGRTLNSCKGLLLNTSYSDGRSGFYFLSGNTIVTFSGMGSEQIKQGPDQATQPIDMIVTNASGQPQKLRVVGTCRFENPFRGRKARVDCRADSSSGRFEGSFVTDGSRPKVTEHH